MQHSIEFTEQPEALIPSWTTKGELYTEEYTLAYIKGLKKTMEHNSRSNLSNHIQSTWGEGLRYYTEWLEVLRGAVPLSTFESTWLPYLNKYHNLSL